jgi:hypothetical protein
MQRSMKSARGSSSRRYSAVAARTMAEGRVPPLPGEAPSTIHARIPSFASSFSSRFDPAPGSEETREGNQQDPAPEGFGFVANLRLVIRGEPENASRSECHV